MMKLETPHIGGARRTGPVVPVVGNVRTAASGLYIGRRWRGRPIGPRRIAELPGSVYANPYRIGIDGDRQTVLQLYEALWRRRLAGPTRRLWLGRLKALAGQQLLCWCDPQPCHGHVLVRLFEEYFT